MSDTMQRPADLINDDSPVARYALQLEHRVRLLEGALDDMYAVECERRIVQDDRERKESMT